MSPNGFSPPLYAPKMRTRPRPRALTYLPAPIVEALPARFRCRPVTAIRSGPDLLPLDIFSRSPWEVEAIAYWYREHIWCEDGDCRCRREILKGEGVCAIRYADDRFGLYLLTHDSGMEVLPWDQVVAEGERLTKAGFESKWAALGDPLAVARAWDICVDAVFGIRVAVRTARKRGLF